MPGRLEWVDLRVLGQPLPIRLWSPSDGALPLLVVHDGPEYDARAGLTRWAGARPCHEATERHTDQTFQRGETQPDRSNCIARRHAGQRAEGTSDAP